MRALRSQSEEWSDPRFIPPQTMLRARVQYDTVPCRRTHVCVYARLFSSHIYLYICFVCVVSSRSQISKACAMMSAFTHTQKHIYVYIYLCVYAFAYFIYWMRQMSCQGRPLPAKHTMITSMPVLHAPTKTHTRALCDIRIASIIMRHTRLANSTTPMARALRAE